MNSYVVNDQAQPTGEHEVHKSGCNYFPRNHTPLGQFATCKEAVQKARDVYRNVDGCAFCIPACHTR